MSPWTHAICEACWAQRFPDHVPIKSDAPEEETCCYCGRRASIRIYVHENPETAPCAGKHPE